MPAGGKKVVTVKDEIERREKMLHICKDETHKERWGGNWKAKNRLPQWKERKEKRVKTDGQTVQ